MAIDKLKTYKVVVPVYQFILTPGQLYPRGSRYPRAAWPPGVKISRGIFTPALIIYTPGGEDTVARASWPPPIFNFLNFEKSKLFHYDNNMLDHFGKFCWKSLNCLFCLSINLQ